MTTRRVKDLIELEYALLVVRACAYHLVRSGAMAAFLIGYCFDHEVLTDG